jgi:diguanylate cyclase (GGDEF)-like protein
MEDSCSNCSAIEAENTVLKERITVLEQQAFHDVLTDLANRRYFLDALQNRVKRCERYGDITALLFLDVDNLKTVNDTYGHQAGDLLLTRFAQILTDNTRATDMVARIGGDEFAILLDNMDGDEVEGKITSLSDRLSKAVVKFDDKRLTLSAAIGYCFIGPKDTVSGLMSRADAAMYKKKNASICAAH